MSTESAPIRKRPGIAAGLYVKAAAQFKGQPYGDIYREFVSRDPEIHGRRYEEQFIARGLSVMHRGAIGGNQVSDASGAVSRPTDYVDTGLLLVERATSVLGQLINRVRRVPFNVSFARADVGATAGWVAEGASLKVTKEQLERVSLSADKKVGALAVQTEELIRFADVDSLNSIGESIGGACGVAIDSALLDSTNSGAGNQPASILYNLPSGQTVASTGSTIALLTADAKTALRRMMDVRGSVRGAVWIMAERVAAGIAALLTTTNEPAFPGISAVGGNWFGLPVLTSEALQGQDSPQAYDIALVAPEDIAVADTGQVDLLISTEASVEMSDGPSGNSLTPTAAQLVNMFQTGSVAIRAYRRINWTRARDAGVVCITGVAVGD
jgi:HK97 family phage major capsid protein